MADLSQYQMSVYEDPDTGKVMPQYYLAGAGRRIPVEQQGQLTPQEKIVTAFSVGAGATMNLTANPISMSGYTDFGVGVVASASHSFAVNVLSSPDGALMMGTLVTSSGTGANKAITGTTILDYNIIQIINSDAAAKTYDIWVRKFNR